MKHYTHAKHFRHPRSYNKRYALNFKTVKNHPLQSIGILTLGMGLISGAVWLGFKKLY